MLLNTHKCVESTASGTDVKVGRQILQCKENGSSLTQDTATGYSRWGRMNVKNDLRPGWSPLQVATDTDPQLVDVCMLPVVW